MGLLGESVERVETMPGPAWLRDGLGIIGYVLFFVFPLRVAVSLFSAAQVVVDAKAMDVACTALVVGYLVLIGIVVRLTPAPRHYAWGRWLLIFVTVPVVLLAVRLLPEHRPDFSWHKVVIYGFCAAAMLQGLSVFGLLGGRRARRPYGDGRFLRRQPCRSLSLFRPCSLA